MPHIPGHLPGAPFSPERRSHNFQQFLDFMNADRRITPEMRSANLERAGADARERSRIFQRQIGGSPPGLISRQGSRFLQPQETSLRQTSPVSSFDPMGQFTGQPVSSIANFLRRDGAPGNNVSATPNTGVQEAPSISGSAPGSFDIVPQAPGVDPANMPSDPLDPFRKQHPSQLLQTAGPQFEVGAGMPSQIDQIDVPETDFNAGQPSFLDKIGGFFKRPGMQDALLAAGAAMMSGRDAQGRAYTDPLQGIGAGLQAGTQAYKADELDRRVEEDRARVEEDREKTLRSIDELIDGFDEDQKAEINSLVGAGVPMTEVYERVRNIRARQRSDDYMSKLDTTLLSPEEYEFIQTMPPEAQANAVFSLIGPEGQYTQRKARMEALVARFGEGAKETLTNAAMDATSTANLLDLPPTRGVHRDGAGILWFVDGEGGTPRMTSFGERAIVESVGDAMDEYPGLDKVYDSIAETADSLRGQPQSLMDYERALGAVDDGAYTGALSEFKKRRGVIMGNDRTRASQELDQVLLRLGIGQLGNFKGAISEAEMKAAFAVEGNNPELLREALYSILRENQRRVLTQIDDHNSEVNRQLVRRGLAGAEYWLLAAENSDDLLTPDIDLLRDRRGEVTEDATERVF